MTQSIFIKPDKAKISEYISDFEKGLLQVPAFQRSFVWNNDKKLDLFDSIKKGYPIGSILLWQPNFEKEEDYDNFVGKELGAYSIPKRNSNSFYILDGFQRLSTLIGCLLHPQKALLKGLVRDVDEWRKKFNIVYNLEVGEFEINRSMNFDKLEKYQIPIYKLVDGKEFFQFQKSLFDEDDLTIRKYIERFEEISLIFQNYELPKINILGGSITEAVDIFQRLNSMGAVITTDWVISARAFGKDNSFILASEIDKLLENELVVYGFQNLKREIILQCITNSFGDVYFDQMSKQNNRKLEDLVDRPDFIPVTKNTFVAIQRAVKFLYEELYVLDSKLLPYNSQLIFITDFFNNVKNPNEKQLKTLKRWFWITTYSNYFTIYNLSKQRLAYNKFQQFIHDEKVDPVFYDNKEKFETLEFPDKIEMGSVRKKALALFMINYSLNINDIFGSAKLDANDIIGLRTMKFFKDESSAENTVFIIEKYFDKNILPKNTKELAEIFMSININLQSEYFIDIKMQEEFRNGNFENVLLARKQLIINSEKIFVENLGINYV
jgi:hypothetical protein